MTYSGAWKPRGKSNFSYNAERDKAIKKMHDENIMRWANKDFNYEYGVTIGQAINLAMQAGNAVGDRQFDDVVFSIFRKSLSLKTDKRFRDEFQRFYEDRTNLNASELEKADKALDAAENSVSDFGDEPVAEQDNTLL